MIAYQQHLHCVQTAAQHERGRNMERSAFYTLIELTTHLWILPEYVRAVRTTPPKRNG